MYLSLSEVVASLKITEIEAVELFSDIMEIKEENGVLSFLFPIEDLTLRIMDSGETTLQFLALDMLHLPFLFSKES